MFPGVGFVIKKIFIIWCLLLLVFLCKRYTLNVLKGKGKIIQILLVPPCVYLDWFGLWSDPHPLFPTFGCIVLSQTQPREKGMSEKYYLSECK